MLGPLCVGLSVFRVQSPAASPDGLPPDLWSLMRTAICRKHSDKRRRIPIADSKTLKLAADTPAEALRHLEPGVLGFCRLLDADACPLQILGAKIAGHECFTRHAQDVVIPLCLTPDQVRCTAQALFSATARAGVTLLALRCRVMNEDEYNTLVRERGNKAQTTLRTLAEHLCTACELRNTFSEPMVIVCDRLGGRTDYLGVLEEIFAPRGARVSCSVQTPRISEYRVEGDGPEIRIRFVVEGESGWLPTALASMTAKYVREVAMARFNRYWSGLLPELKPTAGYRNDAWRWLDDAAPVLKDQDRAALIRER